MTEFPHLSDIVVSTPSKIVLLVIDGLGGMPHPETGRSELETARIPNLDALAKKSVCGLLDPVLPGITPGSGPGHLALFGYDPVEDLVGRGVLETLGIDIELRAGDLAARGNFCTVDPQGLITDRRAGRIPTQESAHLCKALNAIKLPGVEVFVHPVQDYRFALVLRGPGLNEAVSETDPQRVGEPPLPARPLVSEAASTAGLINSFIASARKLLSGREYANMVTLRGFSQLQDLPSMGQLYKLKPAAIAYYPMYRGLARTVGMTVLPTGPSLKDAAATLADHVNDFDFFYVHYKAADSAGEDGDFARKVRALEEADAAIPDLLALKPDVFAVTGDHSTPAVMVGHSWHPVPVALYTQGRPGDWVEAFSERACSQGSLGRMPSRHLMLLLLANAMKLIKFGA